MSLLKAALENAGVVKETPCTAVDKEEIPDEDEVTEAKLAEIWATKQKMGRRARRAVLKSAAANIHAVSQVSLLDSKAPSQQYRGMYNLAGIILIVSNLRLVVENMMKYGILLKLPNSDQWKSAAPCVLTLCAMPLLPWLAHVVEAACWTAQLKVLKARHSEAKPSFQLPRLLLPTKVLVGLLAMLQPSANPELPLGKALALLRARATFLHTLLTLVSFFGPAFVLHHTQSKLVPGIVVMLASVVCFMKLISYAQVMAADNARALEFGDGGIAISDKNNASSPSPRKSPRLAAQAPPPIQRQRSKFEMTPGDLATLEAVDFGLGSIFYFMAAPTLCYQHTYPRSPHIRKRFIVRRIVELCFCVTLQGALVQQFVEPLMKNAVKFTQGESWNYIGLFERILKLSVPNLAVWLLMFYGTFHSALNLTGELLRFSDRLFYKDWWNAVTLKDYWNRWNMPVHNWVLRHLYGPAIRRGFSNMQAQFLVFFVSAALHEVLVSIPAHSFKLWAFFGMMGQVPLIMFTQWLSSRFPHSSAWGNSIFWVTFCVLGQPIIILAYYKSLSEIDSA